MSLSKEDRRLMILATITCGIISLILFTLTIIGVRIFSDVFFEFLIFYMPTIIGIFTIIGEILLEES